LAEPARTGLALREKHLGADRLVVLVCGLRQPLISMAGIVILSKMPRGDEFGQKLATFAGCGTFITGLLYVLSIEGGPGAKDIALLILGSASAMLTWLANVELVESTGGITLAIKIVVDFFFSGAAGFLTLPLT